MNAKNTGSLVYVFFISYHLQFLYDLRSPSYLLKKIFHFDIRQWPHYMQIFLFLGKLSLKEYIGDMYRGDDEEEPDWVKSEREQFNTYRDKDGDGFMDGEEVKNWILPPDFDHAEAEARHLIYEADIDADEQLTKDEVLEKYDLFVGSQATDFGEALARHDEF